MANEGLNKAIRIRVRRSEHIETAEAIDESRKTKEEGADEHHLGDSRHLVNDNVRKQICEPLNFVQLRCQQLIVIYLFIHFIFIFALFLRHNLTLSFIHFPFCERSLCCSLRLYSWGLLLWLYLVDVLRFERLNLVLRVFLWEISKMQTQKLFMILQIFWAEHFIFI